LGGFTLTQIAVLALVKRPSPLLGWTGIVCYLFANGLFWWSLFAHGKKHPAFAFVPVSPVSFTRSGPYRFIRHPIYSSYLLAWIAGAVFAGQAWLLIPVAWMWHLYNRAAQQEEQSFLTSSFAREYQKYQIRTGRFLPKWTF
jgi:protein-S-isoprenylcysteine O-methyltransferase Ste14